MRLDKYLCASTELTRSLAKKTLHRGEVSLNGEIIKDPSVKIGAGDQVHLNGELLKPFGTRYLMLNKLPDTLCSTMDELHPSVLSALDIPKRELLRIAGRLDVDTTGLVLITDDGQWSHRITSPRRECPKRYRAQLADPVGEDAIEQFAQGIQLRGEDCPTRPATLELLSPTEVLLTISEGKYHQVKRMFGAIGNKVVVLHREQIGAIELDPALAPGQWRYLTRDEIDSVG